MNHCVCDCPFCVSNCIVWPSSIYGRWLPLRYLQTFITLHEHLVHPNFGRPMLLIALVVCFYFCLYLFRVLCQILLVFLTIATSVVSKWNDYLQKPNWLQFYLFALFCLYFFVFLFFFFFFFCKIIQSMDMFDTSAMFLFIICFFILYWSLFYSFVSSF